MKIINATWFAEGNGSLIGIVTGEDEHTGAKKAYIGTARGRDEEQDTQHIVINGAKFHIETAERLVDYLTQTITPHHR